ncbi:MAG: CPBP family intramembrane metalloprotease [Lentisphaerae bacterium]|nr:CPBP family intramembrane metalloprotease [Lentisphaerota bacterium]
MPYAPALMVFAGAALALLAAGILADLALLWSLSHRPVDWAACRRRLALRPWKARDAACMALLLVLVNAAFFLTVRLAFTPAETARPGTLGVLLPLQTLLFHGLALLLILLLMRVRRLSWSRAFAGAPAAAPRCVRLGLLFYVAALPPFAAATLAGHGLLKLLGWPVQPQGIVLVFFAPDYPIWLKGYLLVLAVVAAPLIEEMVFRGVAFPVFSRRLRLGSAVALSALLFACVHMHLPAFLPLFVMAAAFALAYLYTGSLLTSIVMHTCFNGVNLAALYCLHTWSLMP